MQFDRRGRDTRSQFFRGDRTIARPGIGGWGGARTYRTRQELARPAAGTILVGNEAYVQFASGSDDVAAPSAVVHVEGRPALREHLEAPVIAAAVTALIFRRDHEPEPIALDQVPNALKDEHAFIWIDLVNYHEAQLREVAAIVGLHRNAVHATLSPWHRPWLAVYPEHCYVSATIARLDPDSYRILASELDLFLGRNYVVSVHKLPLPFDERILARVRQTPELLTEDAAYLLFIMLDELLAHYEELNRTVQEETAVMEERALRDSSDRFLEDLLRFKRYTFALFGLGDQHREVFAAFLRPDFTWVRREDIEPYFRDLQDRLARLLDALLAAKEAVNGAFDIYVSHLSFRSNQVIKTLTIVSTILFTATLLVALFGTTVQGLVPAHATVWFVLELVGIVGITAVIFVAFRRQGWL